MEDESIPQNIEASWKKLAVDLAQVNKIEIPRFVNMYPNESIQIDGLCEDLQRAYGHCKRSRYGSVMTQRMLTAKLKWRL